METSNYRHRAFHKTGYQMPATSFPMANTAVLPLEKDNRLVAHFAYPGIEKNTGATGFAYGSEASYTSLQDRHRDYRQGRFDDRTSAERLKLKKQQKEAEQDIEAYQERKTKQLHETVAEKKRDLEMLQNYKPWGREAGGGAPRASKSGTRQTRRQRLDFELSDGSEYAPFGKSGGGAPLKTGSGKLQTSLKADPDIRFQDKLKKEVNETLRYKPDLSEEKPYYSPREEPLAKNNSGVLRKIEEREKRVQYAKKLEEQQIEAQERKKKEKAEIKENTFDYPWGKNQVDRDESGKLKTRKWMLGRDIPDTTSNYPGLAAQLGREGAGAPLRGKSGKPRTRIAGTIQHVDALTGQEKESIYDPWGRPGAGAPLKDQHGEATKTGVYGACCTEKRSAHKQVVANKREAGRGYGMDVASWMRTGEVGMPKPRNPVTGEPIGANKKTSDVTADRFSIRPAYTQMNDERRREYFTNLQLQAEQRHREIQKQREAERNLEREHIDKITNMWDGGEKQQVRSRQRQRDMEPDKVKQVEKKLEYYNDLQRMINDHHEQRKMHKANIIQSEREHIATFDKVWGRPGAGAPRMDQQGQLETVPRNNSMIKTHVHNGWNFRRT